MASAKVLILDLADTLTTEGRLQSDAVKFLEHAKRQHHLILISNSLQRDMEDVVQVYNIEHFFDLLVSAYEFEMKKPDPRIINIALTLLKDKTGESVSKENVVLIGDRPDTDIKAGNLAGIKTIRIRRGSYSHLDPDFDDEKPKLEFKTLEEAGEYLGILKPAVDVYPKETKAKPRPLKKTLKKGPAKKKVAKKAASSKKRLSAKRTKVASFL